jgi:hypothetical protein
MARKAAAKKVEETPELTPSGLPTGVSWGEVVTYLAQEGFSPKNLVRVPKTPIVYIPQIEGDAWAKITWSYLNSALTYTVESLTLIRKESVRMVEVKDVTYEERE